VAENAEAMTELLALVSIVSGAAVAIVVPFVNSRLERDRLAAQGSAARHEELRGLLDDAVQHLWTTWTVFFEVAEEGRRPSPSPERLRELAAQLAKQVDVIVADTLRVKLRTPHGIGIVEAHERAQAIVLEHELALRHYLDSEDVGAERPPAPITQLSEAMGEFMDEIRTFVGVVQAVNHYVSEEAP
jgi:hypothetical protein